MVVAEERGSSLQGVESGLRVFAVSDLHVDHAQNLSWVRQLPAHVGSPSVLILAGDISHRLELIEETLVLLLQKFDRVFFCPGNHELWVERGAREGDTRTSLDKLDEINRLCKELGVDTAPACVENVWLVPISSWYHASFDRQPEWEGALPVTKVMTDFRACRWPASVDPAGDDLAKLFDTFNDPQLGNLEYCLEEEASGGDRPVVISFSHFVPRNDLIPEKEHLFYKNLPKAVGSDWLRERIHSLSPAVHVFGHTHFSWDSILDDVRYVQWPLAYPKEQERRRKYGIGQRYDSAGGDTSTHPFSSWKPLEVYNSVQGVTRCRRTYWANHYGQATVKGPLKGRAGAV